MAGKSKGIIKSMKSKDINWSSYYANIRDACPWSGFAYQEGKLLHTPWRSWSKVVENEHMMMPMKLWCVAYLDCPFTVEELDAWVEQRNGEQTHTQYYFSHPEHNPNNRATPVPMLIQQRADVLDMARKGVFDQGMKSLTRADHMVEQYQRGQPTTPRGKWKRTAKRSINLRKPDKNE